MFRGMLDVRVDKEDPFELPAEKTARAVLVSLSRS